MKRKYETISSKSSSRLVSSTGFSIQIPSLPLALFILIFFAACNVGPKYSRTAVKAPPAYKELTPADFKETEGWKVAQPKDDQLRGKWWEIFNDPQLNALEEQIDISNQNLAAAEANFRSARALVKQARSQFYPLITTSPSAARTRISSTIGSSRFGAGGYVTDIILPLDVSWEADLWGRIHNTVKLNAFEAQATDADLENTRLSVQAQVASLYFQLRTQDSLKELLDATVIAFQQSLELTRVRFQTGIASDQDVAQAETQLYSTQAQAIDLGIQRAQFEHAIAVLIGQPASTFSIPVEALKATPPAIPFGVPSALLERRPDVAGAERRMAAANAQIGVAKAAFYPSLTLALRGGFETSSIGSWLAYPSRIWSVGPTLAQTIFAGGALRAATEQSWALYDGTVATYRQTVLMAFQEVEDNLAALRLLSKERLKQEAAIISAARFLMLANERYRLGIDNYLNVILAQTALLNNQRTEVSLRMQQMTASVQLIMALGGSWDASQLPSYRDVTK
jgi:NodT family efflux transporter outer membrane factor (OMF) lipoprotein